MGEILVDTATPGLPSCLVLAENALLLVAGGTDNLRSLLTVKGYSEDAVRALGDSIEVFAAKTLFESGFPQVPPHFLGHLEHKEEAS